MEHNKHTGLNEWQRITQTQRKDQFTLCYMDVCGLYMREKKVKKTSNIKE